MPSVARLKDLIEGMTDGEHNGHAVSHPPCKIEGSIVRKCSSNVYVNGRPVALVGSETEETDCCCPSPQTGTVKTGSPKVFVNKVPLARLGDEIEPHNGEVFIISGSGNVFAN